MNTKSRIHLSSAHTSGFEKQFILDELSNLLIGVKGDNIAIFENKIEDYLDDEVYAAALNTGTAALHLALILLGVEAGDEVICQSMTFSASANPILYVGAKPIFVDSEPNTWNLCPVALEQAIKDRIFRGKKPKAIIAVHLYGMPFQYDLIKSISDKYSIPIIEDSAEALGSCYKSKKCGTLGDISILSFNGNKIITTSGGGCLISKSKQIKDKAIFLSTQARDHGPHYQHSQVGYNYRMGNVSAGIGCGQMIVLDKYVALRRANHQFYKDFFLNNKEVAILQEPNSDFYSNYWLSTIVLKSYKKREALRLAFEQENIESRPLWKPMHLQPVFNKCPYYGGEVAEQLFEKGLCLPSGSNLTSEEKNRIKAVFERFF